MGEKMTKAPVYFTIAGVRFNTILAMDALVATIQERFRVMDFPDYQVSVVGIFNLAAAIQPGSQVPMSQMVQHGFGNADRITTFVLTQNSLSLRTTVYETFEAFSALFMRGLAIVHDVIKLGYTEQVGIRFLDAVLPQADEDLTSYLAASVQGLSKAVEGEIVHAFSETKVKDGATMLTARTVIQNGAVGFPPDLHPVILVVDPRFTSYKGLHAILDTDGSYEHREPFDISRLEAVVSNLHTLVVKAFKASVTPEAIARWR